MHKTAAFSDNLNLSLLRSSATVDKPVLNLFFNYPRNIKLYSCPLAHKKTIKVTPVLRLLLWYFKQWVLFLNQGVRFFKVILNNRLLSAKINTLLEYLKKDFIPRDMKSHLIRNVLKRALLVDEILFLLVSCFTCRVFKFTLRSQAITPSAHRTILAQIIKN